jgi:ERCC4-type nuclease
MTRSTYDTVCIFKDIKKLIHDAVKLDVFVGERPTAADKQRDAMIVISMPYGIRNISAIQTSTLRIEVIVKNKSQGVQNVSKLESLTNTIQELFPYTSADNAFCVQLPDLTLKGKDGLGFTIWQLQASMYISKLETFNH